MSTTTTPAPSAVVSATIDRFLAAVTAGSIPPDLYAPEVVVDATVPGWRFHIRGPEAVAAEYGRWFADPGEFAELRRRPFPGGEAVEYLLTWQEDGVDHAAHHVHLVDVDPVSGLIVADTVSCSGRWGADLLAQMRAGDDNG